MVDLRIAKLCFYVIVVPKCITLQFYGSILITDNRYHEFNPLNAELNHISHLLALLGAHHIFHVSRISVNKGCPLRRTVRFKIPSPSPNPMTIPSIPRI